MGGGSGLLGRRPLAGAFPTNTCFLTPSPSKRERSVRTAGAAATAEAERTPKREQPAIERDAGTRPSRGLPAVPRVPPRTWGDNHGPGGATCRCGVCWGTRVTQAHAPRLRRDARGPQLPRGHAPKTTARDHFTPARDHFTPTGVAVIRLGSHNHPGQTQRGGRGGASSPGRSRNQHRRGRGSAPQSRPGRTEKRDPNTCTVDP